MKNAFSTLAEPTWSLNQFLEAAVKYGYEGLDLRGVGEQIDVTRLPEFTDRLDETLNSFAHHSLQIAGLSTSAACSVPAEKRQDHLDEVQRVLHPRRRDRAFGQRRPALHPRIRRQDP